MLTCMMTPLIVMRKMTMRGSTHYSYYFDENQDELKYGNEEDEETFPLQKTNLCQMCGEEAFVMPNQLPIRNVKETLF